MERRLAAILVADVVGYSRHVQRGETMALAVLKDMLDTVVQPSIATHRGRVVKIMGDGLMAEFTSVVEAVSCAAEIQAMVADRQVADVPDNRIIFRIGVNLGDVLIEGDDLLGDGVNIAARLEKLCPPGDVLISGSAYEQVAGKIDACFEYAGEQRLKNIERAVKVYNLPVSGQSHRVQQELAPEKPTVAVLPFENMSGDPKQAYFSDGITEDVITELSRFAELTVIARNSSFAFRDKAVDVREIGRTLTDSFEPGDQDRSKAFLEAAVQLDPHFARAYSGLDFLHLNHAADCSVGVPRDQDNNRVKALEYAGRALALDPSDPRIQCTFGYICLTWRDFERAELHLNRARRMNSNDPMIQITWAWKEGALGRPEAGLVGAEMAIRLNPLYPGWYNYFRSRLLFNLERFGEATTLFEQRTFDSPSKHPRDMAWRAASYGHLGRTDEAKRCGEIFVQSISGLWRGEMSAGPAEYVDWLVDASYMREPKDIARLREGLRLAGLPA